MKKQQWPVFHGIVDAEFIHTWTPRKRRKRKLNEHSVLRIARLYSRRSEWSRLDRSSYNWAKARGPEFFDACCRKMIRAPTRFTKAQLRDSAKEFEYLRDWRKVHTPYYRAALRYGPRFFKNASRHLKKKQQRFLRYTERENGRVKLEHAMLSYESYDLLKHWRNEHPYEYQIYLRHRTQKDARRVRRYFALGGRSRAREECLSIGLDILPHLRDDWAEIQAEAAPPPKPEGPPAKYDFTQESPSGSVWIDNLGVGMKLLECPYCGETSICMNRWLWWEGRYRSVYIHEITAPIRLMGIIGCYVPEDVPKGEDQLDPQG